MKQSTIIMIVAGVIGIAIVGGILFMNMNNSSSSATNTQEMNNTTSVAETESNMNNENKQTIVDIAAGNPDFSTLVAAVKAAGLDQTLMGEGPFTVFAPTNAAFEKLPEGTVESLLKDKEKLTQILTYHVVSGKVMSNDVAGMNSATTVEGSDVAIKTENGVVMINDAQVVTPDIEAGNGVIHVIDTVLIPQ